MTWLDDRHRTPTLPWQGRAALVGAFALLAGGLAYADGHYWPAAAVAAVAAGASCTAVCEYLLRTADARWGGAARVTPGDALVVLISSAVVIALLAVVAVGLAILAAALGLVALLAYVRRSAG